jgi:hypothetical protein
MAQIMETVARDLRILKELLKPLRDIPVIERSPEAGG